MFKGGAVVEAVRDRAQEHGRQGVEAPEQKEASGRGGGGSDRAREGAQAEAAGLLGGLRQRVEAGRAEQAARVFGHAFAAEETAAGGAARGRFAVGVPDAALAVEAHGARTLLRPDACQTVKSTQTTA